MRRATKEFGTLAIASAIVLSVCGVAVASMAGVQIEQVLEYPGSLLRAGSIDRYAQATIAANGVSAPVEMVAEVRVRGWRDRADRLADVSVVTARAQHASELAQGSTVSPEHSLARSLAGRRVLASLTSAARAALPTTGRATVGMVAVPQGETVGLVINEVITPRAADETTAPATAPAAVSAPTTSAAVPVVTSLSRYWGKPGTNVAILGSGFGASQADGHVSCSGARATVVSWSDTRIVFAVPVEATEPGYVGVWAGGRSSNGKYFVPSDQPTVTSISPREGAPGTVVTVRGSNFGLAQSDGWVSFAGASGDVVSWSDTEIRVVVPRNAMSGYAGVVANGLSSNGTLYAPYGLPVLEEVSSARLVRGDAVTLLGRSFGSEPGTIVLGRARITPQVWEDDRITFTVPAGVSSNYLGVLKDDDSTSNGVWVNVVPRMVAISRWWASPGDEIVMTGVGFEASPDVSGYTAYVGGRPAQVLSWSDSSIKVRVPADAPSGYVGVGCPAATSNGVHLVVVTPADVRAVTPDTAAPGADVEVTGSGFGPSRDDLKVTLGGAECEIVSWSATKIVFTVPPGASSGYVGVSKNNVSSNGVWLKVAP